MPTIPVDESGTVVYYEDSGEPEGSHTYLTVVLIHGILFHGAIFKNLIPHAAANNLRLIRVNQRDYPGSTPYSAQELETIASNDFERRAVLLQTIGNQLSTLVVNLAKELHLPPISIVGSKRSGGVALSTWSMGNCLALAMLSNASSLPAQVRQDVAKYMRTLVMLDPVAGTTMGGTPSQGTYHPFRDPTLPIQERVDRAQFWLSFYFTKVVDLESVTTEVLESRVAQHEQLGLLQASSAKTPTLLRMSSAELESAKDRAALLRSSLPLLRSNSENFRLNFEKALFDTDGVLPSVNVVVAWCDETMGDAVFAAKIIHDRLKAEQPAGKVRRNIEMYRLEGMNHFPHCDFPEKVIEMFTNAL
ncbi:hypothetical protein PHLGIDRAFT_35631 [Phlebiopsis gigantea 11061_1 CR5-6]|uniref:AB hydrolase-1 domain-containing protein n=1 Tax=Phlebiopsis gigantea (strain 11061_1 CR5-6) TaxID=745531 RepID=A0A0C3PL20_PHLG1|nr:hypothetical protein PHLGIDRAFT_35631 [Phlebiopsis gigantea 11061_1 CR5-6]